MANVSYMVVGEGGSVEWSNICYIQRILKTQVKL